MVSQLYPNLEPITENNFINSSLVEKNNKRWIELSEKQQKGEKRKIVGCAGITALVANSLFLGSIIASCGAIATYGASGLNSMPNLVVGLIIAGAASTISSTASIISCCIPKEWVGDLNEYHLQKVLDARQEILEGNSRRGSQLLKCGLLSKEIYDEFILLGNEKRKIENKCRNAIYIANKSSSKMEIIKEQIDSETLLYEQSMEEWNKKWEAFKPSLIADLPDPNAFTNAEIIDV